MHICLDPGHGGRDAGATHVDVREADLNLSFALAARDALRAAGHEVALTRDADVYVPLSHRGVASTDSDAVICLHVNAGGPLLRGVRTFFKPGSDPGKALAQSLQDHAPEGLGTTLPPFAANYHDWTQRANNVLSVHRGRDATSPVVLYEVGFLTSARDRDIILAESFPLALASNIVQAVGIAAVPLELAEVSQLSLPVNLRTT